jgi:type I restriction enzyme R subunit
VPDRAMLNDAGEEKLEREFRQEYHLITRDDRLDTIAKDIVNHFVSRGHKGKGMVISIDRFTSMRMVEKVQRHWWQRTEEVKKRIAAADSDFVRGPLMDELEYLQSTDMAVVISSSRNEIRDFDKKGMDIRPHRKRIMNERLDEKFKDPDDPLRLVFVCAMWITGFDVPSLSTLYPDKPMKNHTLMQTIARA